MINYREKKARVRQLAIEWEINFNNWPRYWSYCAEWSARFERIGRKYGLMREFKENGIL